MWFGLRPRVDLSNYPIEVVETKDLLLPLHYTKTPDVILSSNFTAYDTFRFEKNFSPYLHLFGPSWRFTLIPKEINDTHYLALEIFDGRIFIQLTDELVNDLQPYVDRALNEFPNYIRIIDSNKTHNYYGTVMSSAWIKSILPFVSLSSVPYIITDDGLYADLRETYSLSFGLPDERGITRPLELSYDSIYATVITKLRYLHIIGSVVLNSSQDRAIINKWNLNVNESLVHQSNPQLQVYHALWHNTLISPSKSEFLEQVSFDQVIVSIPNPLNVRMNESEDIKYNETHMIVKLNGYLEANELMYKFRTLNT